MKDSLPVMIWEGSDTLYQCRQGRSGDKIPSSRDQIRSNTEARAQRLATGLPRTCRHGCVLSVYGLRPPLLLTVGRADGCSADLVQVSCRRCLEICSMLVW